MGEFSIAHIAIVVGLYIVFFGHKKLPELGKGLGEAIRGFKKAMNTTEEPKAPPAPPQQLSQKTEDSLLKDQKEHDVSKTPRS